MSTRCIYNGKRLIPCPFLTLSKQFNRADDGTLLSTSWTGTIRGKIVSFMGSPDHNGDFWGLAGYPPDESPFLDEKLGYIFRKQEAIRKLFSEDGYLLEFQSANASQPIKCNPRITGIEFEEGNWVDICNYVITFEADILYMNGTIYGDDNIDNLYLKSATETWQIEPNEDLLEDITNKTFKLIHDVKAQGKTYYNVDRTISSGGWERAREYVRAKLGYNSSIISGSLNNQLPDYLSIYNHTLNENIDERDGSYSVTESWLLASGTAVESFNVSTRTSLDNGLSSVTIDGEITGFEQRDANDNIISTKYNNALKKFSSISGNIIGRAVSYSNINLNIIPTQSTIGRNINNGTISYSYDYNNRPSNLINGCLSESFTINDNIGNDVIAIIPIPGRTNGPIIQDIATKTEKTRNITVELVMPIPSGTLLERYNSSPYSTVSGIVESLKPTGTKVFTTQNGNPNWDVTNGRFSYTKEWTYEV